MVVVDVILPDTFLGALSQFMREQLHMAAADVDSLLCEEHRLALCTALDRDGNGKVRGG